MTYRQVAIQLALEDAMVDADLRIAVASIGLALGGWPTSHVALSCVGQSGGPSFYIPGIPQAISDRDVERWARILRLDEAQQALLADFYDVYLRSEPALRTRYLEPVFAQARDIVGIGMPFQSVDLAESAARVMTFVAPRAVDSYLQAEGQLLNSLHAVLHEGQAPWMDLVKRQRTRACWTAFPGRYPAAEVDLTLILDGLEIDEFDMTPTDDELYASLLLSYDSSLSLLAEHRGDRLVDTMSKGVVLQAQQMAGVVYKPDAAEARKELRQRLLRVEERIHDINVQALQNFGALLPQATRRELVTRFRVLAYQPIYPDPTEIDSTLALALEIEELSESERAGIEAIIRASQVRRDAICDQMVRRYCEWRAYDSVEWSTPGDIIEAYANEMREMHMQRIIIAEQAMRDIQDVLGPIRSLPIDKSFDKARKRMAEFPFQADWRRNI